MHTLLLNSFCENLNVISACNHCSYNVDFTYNFDMVRYCTLDHFILTGMLFANCVQTVSVAHDIGNTSDHDLLLLHLRLELRYVSLDKKERSPHPSWQKANPAQLGNYCQTMSENLASLYVPSEAIVCRDPNCCDSSHYDALQNYVAGIYVAVI